MLTRNPDADQASADVKRPARKRARAENAAATVLKRIRQQRAAARKAARKAAASYYATQRRFWKGELDRAISPQANWRDVGQELRKIWRRQIQTCDDDYWSSVYHDTPHGQLVYYWIELVGNALHGKPSSLLKHLRRGLTLVDSIMLADTLALILPDLAGRGKQTGGRPKRAWARSGANKAIKFYRDWKDANRRNGIRDWGHGDEMKDEACRFAIELYGNDVCELFGDDVEMREDPPTWEDLRELIDRPQSRRG